MDDGAGLEHWMVTEREGSGVEGRVLGGGECLGIEPPLLLAPGFESLVLNQPFSPRRELLGGEGGRGLFASRVWNTEGLEEDAAADIGEVG